MKTDRMTCRPPKGKSYLTIGQDLFSVDEYVKSQYNASLHEGETTSISTFVPAAVMVYTDLDKLNGLNTPVDYGSGIEFSDGLLQLFQGAHVGLQIGLWLNGTYGCDQINRGEKETQINKLITYLQNCKSNTIFLRIGYEFDNPFFGYSQNPKSYVQSYRHIVTSIKQAMDPKNTIQHHHVHMKNILFVWHSWAAPRGYNTTLLDFYPGDDYVDWIGISIFQQLYPWPSHWSDDGIHDWGGSYEDIDEVLQFSKTRNKPTMIAESTPFGGINLQTLDSISYNETDPWDRWFGKVLKLIDNYDISMWSYINCDWESQPMWKGVGFGDTRLSTNPEIMEKWKKYVLKGDIKQRFLFGNSLASCDEDQNKSNVISLGFLSSTSSKLDLTLVKEHCAILFWCIIGCFIFFSLLKRIFFRTSLDKKDAKANNMDETSCLLVCAPE